MSQALTILPIKIEHRATIAPLWVKMGNALCVWDAIKKYKIPANIYPTVVKINGKVVLRKDWYKLFDAKVHEVTFITIPQGDFFKSILNLIATIALVLVAPYAAGVLGGVLGISSQLGLQLLQAGIVLAGSFLINTFLGPSVVKPETNAASSPTYSITGQGNTARLFQAIPKLYGEHIIFPDYAAQPYSEYVDNQQYLNQLLCLGLGEYEQKSWRIEDTEFWNSVDGLTDSFTGIEFELIQPGQPVTLFHSQVITSDEVGGQDLYAWEVDNSFTFTAVDKHILSNNSTNSEARQFTFALPGQIISVTTGANAGVYTVVSVATDRTWVEVAEAVTDASYSSVIRLDQTQNYLGPFVANPANTVTNKLQVDYLLGSGLFYTSDSGRFTDETVSVSTEAQEVDSAGIPIGSWMILGNHTYTRSTSTPQRITETYEVTDGRYRVRVHRTSPSNQSSRSRSEIQWGSLKAFIPNDNVYPDVTLLALRILATGQLTQRSSNRINVIQVSKLPTWDDVNNIWTAPVATRSIAWIAADIIRNETYGAGYDSAYIDKTMLKQLHDTWLARGDSFNGVFDTTYSMWEALQAVLRVGRTSPVLIAGKITFVRDEPRALPRGMFTPANMVRGSFETQHILFDDESPDDIIMEFMDERTWKMNEVQCTQVGSLSAKPERIQLFGCTIRNQAWREGMFIGAVNARRRIVANFTTELDGRLLMRGDLVSVAHDLYDWGQSGQVLGYDSGTRILDLSEYVKWGSLTESYIKLRKRNGKAWGPVLVHKQPDSREVLVDATDLTAVEAVQGNIEDVFNLETDSALTIYNLGDLVTEQKDWILISGVPKDENVSLTVMVEDPEVHTADEGDPPPETFPLNPTVDPTRPVISFFSVSENLVSDPAQPTVTYAWGASSFADFYRLQRSYDNIVWETVYEGPATSYVEQVFAGLLYARVQGVNTQAGAWRTFQASFGTSTTLPLPVASITYAYSMSSGTLSVSWPVAIRATSYRLVVRSESVPGSANFDVIEITKTLTSTSSQFNSADILAVGGPWPAIKIQVISINAAGESSPTEVIEGSITLDPVTSLSLQSPYNRGAFTAQWRSLQVDDFDVSIIVDGVTELTYNTLNNTQFIPLADLTAEGGPWRQLTVRVVSNLGTISSTPANLVVTAPTILAVTGVGATITANNVKLDWFQTADNGVPKTRVRHNTVNNYGTSSIINTQTKAAGAGATYTHTGQAPGSHYYWITAWDDVLGIESSPVQILATVQAVPLALSSFTSTYAAPRLGRAAFSIDTAADPVITSVKIFRVAAGGTVNPLTDTPITTIPVAASSNYTYTDGDATRTNIVTNSSVPSDASGWSLGTGWAWLAGVIKKTAGTASTVSQNIGQANTDVIRWTWTIGSRTAGQVTPGLTGSPNVNGVAKTANGVYYERMTANAAGLLRFLANANFDGSIDDIYGFKESVTSAPDGNFDYKAYAYNSQGMNGPVSNIAGIRIV